MLTNKLFFLAKLIVYYILLYHVSLIIKTKRLMIGPNTNLTSSFNFRGQFVISMAPSVRKLTR